MSNLGRKVVAPRLALGPTYPAIQWDSDRSVMLATDFHRVPKSGLVE
jgi:hypothetical protein